MSETLKYKYWPNADGNLGNKKVQIPDGVNTFWPEGDALIGNFIYKDGKLAGFVDTKALTVNGSKTTVINYDCVDIELPFTEGEIAITRGDRSKYFNVRYNPINDDNVVITLKYKGCKTVDDVKAVDPDYLTNDIVDGVWSEGLGDLEDGDSMFYECGNLTSFSSELSSLTWGNMMFNECGNLTSFNADLSSLTNGFEMFNNCKLDAHSVANIVHILPQRDTKPTSAWGAGTISIGVGCDNTEADQLIFAQECGCETWQELLDDFSAKNWKVYFGCNGRPTEAATYGMRRGETLPIYTKLEEVTDEKHAQYTSADVSKFFNIKYFHSTNGSTEGYTQFASLEEAIETLNIKPIERN